MEEGSGEAGARVECEEQGGAFGECLCVVGERA